MFLHPARRDHARVGARQYLRVANRPGQRHDEQQKRHRRQRPEATGKRTERRHERKHVAVEVRPECQQVDEVCDDENGENQVDALAPNESDDQAKRTQDQDRAEPSPEPVDERDRRGVVVLEAEPPVARELLDSKSLVPGLTAVHQDEWARSEEPGEGERGGHRESAPLSPARNDEREEQEHPRILEAHGGADGEPRELETPLHHQCERNRNPERQRDIGNRRA